MNPNPALARLPSLPADRAPSPPWPVLALLGCELRLAWRRRSDVAIGLAFFALVTSLFPLALGPDPERLRALAGGITWLAALLAALLPLPRLFQDELADGTLGQWLLSPVPLPLLAGLRAGAHWIACGLPLVLAAPAVALACGLPAHALPVLCASLLLGTPVLSLLGTVMAALTAGLRGGAMLLALLLLPLAAPLLVFGAAAVERAQAGLPAGAPLALLGAALLLALAGAPPAAAMALRIAQES